MTSTLRVVPLLGLLVAFAASPEGLRFRSTLLRAVAEDLNRAMQYRAAQAYLRATVDRYPHDVFLHFDLAAACMRVQPPDNTEVFRHVSAASLLRPERPLFHMSWVTVTTARVVARPSPLSQGDLAGPRLSIAYLHRAGLLKKDWDGAITAFRESIHQKPDNVMGYVGLGGAMMCAGRHDEGLQVMLAELQRHPTRTDNPMYSLRYNAACYLMNCVDGTGPNAPPPAKRSDFRKHALAFLTADVAALRKLAATDPKTVYDLMQEGWHVDEDFASVRDPKALEQLPPEERDA